MADKPRGIPKKRNRIPVSCESCRIRKLKCDRQRPCLNCTSRSIECAFAGGGLAKTRTYGPTQTEDLRSKLQRLEQMVSLMAENSMGLQNGDQKEDPVQQDTPETPDTNTSSSPPSSPDLDARTGHLYLAVNGQHYIGGSNWETVVQEVASIREQYEEEIPYSIQDRVPYMVSRNPALLGGVNLDMTLPALVEGLPSRVFADRLLTRFFEYYDPAVPSRQMLHRPTFLKGFDKFWVDKDVMRFCPGTLGTIYAVFCLALQSYTVHEDEPSDLRGKTVELADQYRHRSAQSLHRADITAPTRQSVECLLLQTMCEYSRTSDGFMGQWLMLGILVRKALSMGLHRDPSEFPALTPFEGEIRRRLWAHIWQFDMLFSFQLGLPNSIQPSRSNVASPINIYEEELTEGMSELPPSRPHDENTEIGYTIAKLNVLRALSGVVEHLNSLHSCTFEEIEALNKKLGKAKEQIPPHLRLRPNQDSVMTPRSRRLQRLYLQMFYDKAACMLNRRFIPRVEGDNSDTDAIRPREICLQSALSMLAIQEEFQHEQCKWWLYHLIKHDFLLAAAILFLVLFTKQKDKQKNTNGSTASKESDEEDARINSALDKSQAIWESIIDVSAEAHSAGKMFKNMRSKLRSPKRPAEQSYLTPAEGDDPQEMDYENENTERKPIECNFSLQYEDIVNDFDWSAWDVSMQAPAFQSLDNFWPA